MLKNIYKYLFIFWKIKSKQHNGMPNIQFVNISSHMWKAGSREHLAFLLYEWLNWLIKTVAESFSVNHLSVQHPNKILTTNIRYKYIKHVNSRRQPWRHSLTACCTKPLLHNICSCFLFRLRTTLPSSCSVKSCGTSSDQTPAVSSPFCSISLTTVKVWLFTQTLHRPASRITPTTLHNDGTHLADAVRDVRFVPVILF